MAIRFRKRSEQLNQEQQSNEVVKKSFHLNIGVVIFIALFVYMIITVVIYLTAHRIISYQVTAGPLSKNENYTAMIMRSEEVVTASSGGYVSYFVSDSSKIGRGGAICAISETANPLESKELTQKELSKMRDKAFGFSKSFRADDFQRVYDFKYSLEDVTMGSGDYSGLSGNICSASYEGYVCYSSDGLEGLTQDDVSNQSFQSKNYKKESLRTEGQVAAGDELYRIITDEEWSIVIPVTDKQTVRLASHPTIKVKFLKDGNMETGRMTLFKNGEERFVKITFSSGMQRYINDRYLDVELVTNTVSGLKIPNSAIVTKEFYTIPVSLVTIGGENGEAGFLKEVIDEDGKVTTSFVETNLYAESQEEDKEAVYYVDMSHFQEGDILVQPDSNTRYIVKNTGSLEGVYCINRGYAMFRKISVLDQNEEFCIVESGTTFGIAQYDYIVYDGSTVREEQIVNN